MYGARSSKDIGLDREKQSIFLSSMLRVSSNQRTETDSFFETCFVMIDYGYGDCFVLTMTEWPKHVENFCKNLILIM